LSYPICPEEKKKTNNKQLKNDKFRFLFQFIQFVQSAGSVRPGCGFHCAWLRGKTKFLERLLHFITESLFAGRGDGTWVLAKSRLSRLKLFRINTPEKSKLDWTRR
jgi:hypothetical protein